MKTDAQAPTGDERVALLHTEQRNPATIGITGLDTLSLLAAINREDQTVAGRVAEALPDIARAVELMLPRARAGGRLVYVGAGTSGRLGYMDASECLPTYGLERVFCVMAGGREAVFRSAEGVEDSAEAAKADLQAFGLTEKDLVFALAASGRTPYCIGALDYAAALGAGRVSLACNPHSALAAHAEVAIEVDTGPEVVMGSTRMKAGTAQKLVLNMVSTALMLRLGRSWDNLMVQLSVHNTKIDNRALRLFMEATGCQDEALARETLTRAGGRLAPAVLMGLYGCSAAEAEAALAESDGDMAAAAAHLRSKTPT